MGMDMTIEFSCETTVILSQIRTKCLSLAVTCLFFFLTGIFLEYLLTYKKIKMKKIMEFSRLDVGERINVPILKKLNITLIYSLLCFLMYLNMFGVMTGNAYLILAITIGNGLGYYLFGSLKNQTIRSAENIGCCHYG